MKNLYHLSLLFFLAATQMVNAQSLYSQGASIPYEYNCRIADPIAQERNHPIDILHMKLNVSFNVKEGKVMGKVNHKFKTLQQNIDTLFFDAPGIKISAARVDGKEANFRTIPAGVVVDIKNQWGFDEEHQISFEYTATPKKGLYFIGWNEPQAPKASVWHTRQQIWTQGQGIDNRHWIPMYDDMGDKFVTETVITFDEKYQVLSNGKLLSKKSDKKGNIVWHYKINNPHAGYLLMMAVGKYSVKSTKTKRGTPVNFWYYPEYKDRVEASSRYTERMIEFLEDETGVPYQWGAYSQVMVQDFLYGAMENTSATICGDFFVVDERAYLDRNYVGVNAHELTHQWFGDLITARGPGDAWLQESFATYYAKIFFETTDGPEAVKFNFRNECNTAFAASKKDLYPIRHTKSGTARIYPKGSAVLSLLRYVIGDEEFKRAINHYLNRHKFGNVNTDDFQKAFKDKLGMNLDWFFEQWIWKGNEPYYKVRFDHFGNRAQFNVTQTQKGTMADGLFKMPIWFSIYYKDGSSDKRKVWVSEQNTIVNFDTKGKNISYVLFDENNEIMKQVDFDKPEAMWIAQAEKAKHGIDRFDAIRALSTMAVDKRVKLYDRLYAKEAVFQVRREMASQLAGLEQGKEFTSRAFADRHARVRETVASKASPKRHKDAITALLKDSSYKVVEAALDNLIRHQIPFFEDQLAGVDGMNNAIAIKYNALKYERSGDAAFADKIVSFAGPAYEFRTRINAFNALKRLNYMSPQAAKNLVQASRTYNRRLANPAAQTIRHFKQQSGMSNFFKGL